MDIEFFYHAGVLIFKFIDEFKLFKFKETKAVFNYIPSSVNKSQSKAVYSQQITINQMQRQSFDLHIGSPRHHNKSNKTNNIQHTGEMMNRKSFQDDTVNLPIGRVSSSNVKAQRLNKPKYTAELTDRSRIKSKIAKQDQEQKLFLKQQIKAQITSNRRKYEQFEEQNYSIRKSRINKGQTHQSCHSIDSELSDVQRVIGVSCYNPNYYGKMSKDQLRRELENLIEQKARLETAISKTKIKENIEQQFEKDMYRNSFSHHYRDLRSIWKGGVQHCQRQNVMSDGKGKSGDGELSASRIERTQIELESKIQRINKKVVQSRIKVEELSKIEKEFYGDSSETSKNQNRYKSQYINGSLNRIIEETHHYEKMRERCEGMQMEKQDLRSVELRRSEMERSIQNKRGLHKVGQSSLDKQSHNELIEIVQGLQKKLSQKEQNEERMRQQIQALKLQLQKSKLKPSEEKGSIKQSNIQLKINPLEPQLQLSENKSTFEDKITKLPLSLSPKMQNLKQMTQIQIERRAKFRKILNDVNGGKTCLQQANHMAAGVSPSNIKIKEIIQSPVTQKFIRKSNSPIFNSGAHLVQCKSSKNIICTGNHNHVYEPDVKGSSAYENQDKEVAEQGGPLQKQFKTPEPTNPFFSSKRKLQRNEK